MQVEEPTAQMVAYLTSAPCLIELNGFTLVDSEQHSLDVAIFRGLEDVIELPGMQFIDYTSSYLPDPIPGEPVSIVGYPGATVAVKPTKADFGFMHLGFRASTVSERQIKLANEFRDRQFSDYENPANQGIALGGLSGSPAFVIRNHQHRFVGILTDCSENDGIVIISRLGCINPDGILDHAAIAW
jgi:hypothetical protein